MATGRIKTYLGQFANDVDAAAFVATEGWCQIVTLICDAAVNPPTIADGGNFSLSGNWVPDANDTLTLLRDAAGIWHELCRSAN